MSISPIIFTFAPVPLSSDLNPLAHAAILARRRQAENVTVSKPRHRIRPPVAKATVPALA
ncbi:MAG: hypothetical protein LV481_14595 [Methylacidiphilales bacterium]|nr:hypothetical protein [Candidatus Methylacidiphilales bacterium]